MNLSQISISLTFQVTEGLGIRVCSNSKSIQLIIKTCASRLECYKITEISLYHQQINEKNTKNNLFIHASLTNLIILFSFFFDNFQYLCF